MPWQFVYSGMYQDSNSLVLCSRMSSGEPIPVVRSWVGDNCLLGYAMDKIGYFVYSQSGGFNCYSGKNYQLLYADGLEFSNPEDVPKRDRFVAGLTVKNKNIYIGSFDVQGIDLCGMVVHGVCAINAYWNNKKADIQRNDYKILAHSHC
ncbi:uncharacterized protein LOC135935776 [Cloeon dipterum]|uniref:uncharacterized protein LOC135935776 n=1 Tax=Cloeon dipterum TaxID=197152 RepID=UPI00322057F4